MRGRRDGERDDHRTARLTRITPAPIAFTYAATKPGVPIRLTGVAATPDMGVKVWVLAKGRAVPENCRHATIDETRIDWLRNGANYPQVVTAAMDEAGGQAFVTDFAGPSSVIDKNIFQISDANLLAMRQETRPGYVARLALESGALLSPLAVPSTAPAAPAPAASNAQATGAVGIDPVSGAAVAVPAGQAVPKAGGFGCAGCQSPARSPVDGAGEGVSFALAAAGWWLLRRRK